MKISALPFEVPEFIRPFSLRCLSEEGPPGKLSMPTFPNGLLLAPKLYMSYYWKNAMLLLVVEGARLMPLKLGFTPMADGPTWGETRGFDRGVDMSLLLTFSYFLKADILSDLSLKSRLPFPLIIWLDVFRSWFRFPSVSSLVIRI